MAQANGVSASPVSHYEDERWMKAALALGRRNLGVTWPNPSVGCILVRTEDGKTTVIGRGTTAPGGRPHAEICALTQAGGRAWGSTAYVTLEPCAHFGRTGPCALALIEAGIGRVVIGTTDPDSRVSGKGVRMMREAGIDVYAGVLEEECRQSHAGHICRVIRGRPTVHLKMAISADGFIGCREKGQVLISSDRSWQLVHVMRSQSDGIVVGIGTVLADDPMLTCRIPGLEERSPVRIVLDTRARLPLESQLVKTAQDVPVFCLTGQGAEQNRCEALVAAGVQVVEVPEDEDGHIALPLTLARLAEFGLTRLMVEGGSRLAGAFAKKDLIDEATFVFGSVNIGENGIAPLDDVSLDWFQDMRRFSEIDSGRLGGDKVVRYRRTR
ncbi:MAG: bifunctional diaminohydroxyphosphoribosylaminopyrimidine deaminase/5-amino-6-(5-phosphoribosylamino)uracil reductase RibD [Stappiaceae bacterium]